MNTDYIAYIGTYSVRGSAGIYSLRVDGGTGGAAICATAQAQNTGYLALSRDGSRLYAVSESMTFDGQPSGGVTAYRAGSGGRLDFLNARLTVGQCPCCVNLDASGKTLYVSNFRGGSIAVFPVGSDGGIAPLKKLIAEEPLPGKPNGMHCTDVFMADRVICTVAVGRQALIFYDAVSFERVGYYPISEPLMPRHLVCSGDSRFVYLIMQSPGVVHVLENKLGSAGGLELIQEISTLPPGYAGPCENSAVRLTPDGSLLLAASRIADSIAVYRVGDADGTLTLADIIGLPGKTPRDFGVTPDGKLVITALQDSDEVCVHEIDYSAGTLTPKSKIGGISSPTSVAVKKAD